MPDLPFDKKIWILWAHGEEEAPPLVRRCIQSWRFQNPDWNLHVLSEADVHSYFSAEREKNVASKMTVQALSDLLRMKLLATEGGVWADATTACAMPLDNWLPTVSEASFFAFDRPRPLRPMASWFLAANKSSYIIHKILEVTLNFWSQETVVGSDQVKYWNKLEANAGTDGLKWRSRDYWHDIEMMPYFWMHYMFDFLLYTDQRFAKVWGRVPKISGRVPFQIQDQNMIKLADWSEERLAGYLTASMAPLYKLDWRSMDPAKSSKVSRILEHCCKE